MRALFRKSDAHVALEDGMNPSGGLKPDGILFKYLPFTQEGSAQKS